jgi:hypothetical protein
MTNLKRLTQLVCESYQTDECIAHCNYGPCCTCERIAKYLATSGEVIPPVDVGDKVWYINGAYYNSQRLEPREIEVTEINKKKSGKTIDWAFIAHGTRYKFSSIGKTVFLTKEACVQEIEKRKLKRRQ